MKDLDTLDSWAFHKKTENRKKKTYWWIFVCSLISFLINGFGLYYALQSISYLGFINILGMILAVYSLIIGIRGIKNS